MVLCIGIDCQAKVTYCGSVGGAITFVTRDPRSNPANYLENYSDHCYCDLHLPDAEGNTFIRKGKVGDWKNHFDDDMNKDWDAWVEAELQDSGFTMEFE